MYILKKTHCERTPEVKYWGRQDGDKRVLPGDYNLTLHPLIPHPLNPDTLECAQKGSLRYHYGGTRFIAAALREEMMTRALKALSVL